MNRVNDFAKIANKQQAYIAGILLSDGHITLNNQVVELWVQLSDKELPLYFKEYFEDNCTYRENYKFNKKSRQFPKAGIIIYSKVFKENMIKLFGGRLKKDKRCPIISKSLEQYLLRGIFDGDGCITWGYRKDRDRLWQKVSFTSSLSILQGVQQILINNNISTIIRPKSNEDCFIMEFSNELDIYRFYRFIYQDLDMFYLSRKYNTFKEWLSATLKKYTLNEGDKVKFISVNTAKKYGLDSSKIDYKKEFIVNKDGDVKLNSCLLRKEGFSNIALRLEMNEINESICSDITLSQA